ncbi:hypothetical protein ACIBL8_19295 [Streptomyces sp. NPDC050523]|uniref:hypothetical protein n=1 Tax=Streptomyces sp. NPDC050523 TaxID=3365622 RepID=UPI0037B47BE3
MTAGRCSRTLRAAVFAVVCVLLAALGHVMMSGTDVPAWALAAGVAVTGGAGWCLADRERGLPLIVTVVVAAQAALHSAFSLAQSATGGTDSMDAKSSLGSVPSMPSMPMGQMNMAGMEAMDPVHPAGQFTGGASSFGMLAAHLLAALLCGLWLAHGERAAFRILRALAGWLTAPLRLLLATPYTPDRPRIRARRRRSERAPRLLLVHAITSRGPPPGTAVV